MSVKESKKAVRMAELVREIEDIKRAKRESSKEFTEQLIARWDELEHLAGDVETGQKSIGDEG